MMTLTVSIKHLKIDDLEKFFGMLIYLHPQIKAQPPRRQCFFFWFEFGGTFFSMEFGGDPIKLWWESHEMLVGIPPKFVAS